MIKVDDGDDYDYIKMALNHKVLILPLTMGQRLDISRYKEGSWELNCHTSVLYVL